MSVIETVAQLAELELFRGLSDAEIQRLLAAAEDVTYPAGAEMLTAGEEQRALWFLLQGEVRIMIPTPGEPDREIGLISAPAVLGEASFFHAGPHSATLECAADARLIRLDRVNFDALLEAGDLAAYKLTGNLTAVLAARLQETDRWIAELLTQERNEHVRYEWRRFRENMSFGGSRSGSGVRPLYGA